VSSILNADPLTPRTDLAIDFMQKWSGDEPLVLTAITPDTRNVSAAAFRPVTERAAAEAWIDQRQGRTNIYFQVNRLLPDFVALLRAGDPKAKKSLKTDLSALTWLHVDLDPRAGEDLNTEKTRAIDLIQRYSPPPTIIISSGGGAQGFWRLAEPQPIDGIEARAIDLERYSQQIMLDLHADPCHNADRIMRLPGTINVPDAKKRAKGRVAALAEVVAADWERVYSLSDFRAVAPRAIGSNVVPLRPSRDRSKRETTEPLPTVDMDKLSDLIPTKLREIITLGEDPDQPARWTSRSEMVYYVACALVRARVPHNTAVDILLAKAHAVGQSIREQRRPREYAERQMRRAAEETESPTLRELNEDHAVISDVGGKCLVTSKIFDYMLDRWSIRFQSFETFCNRYMNVKIAEGNKSTPKGKWWLNHPLRRQFDTVTFAPEREVENAYNLWRGFGVEAVPGDCSLLLDHVRTIICREKIEIYEALMDLLATWIQHPDRPGGIAIVIRGGEGAGKGILFQAIGKIFGDHFIQVTNSKHLVGNFNAHLRDCAFLFADEAFFAGDRAHAGILKGLITEDTLPVEGKGLDVERAPNCVHIGMSSNEEWVVPASHDSRRYFVLDVAKDRIGDTVYFDAIRAQLYMNGGIEALFHLLRTREVTSETRMVPQTEGLQMQRTLSYSLEESWWEEKLIDGESTRNSGEWHTDIAKADLQDDYFEYAQRTRATRPMNATGLGIFLRTALPAGWPRTVSREKEMVVYENGEGRVLSRRRPCYELPDLTECREAWTARHGTKFD